MRALQATDERIRVCVLVAGSKCLEGEGNEEEGERGPRAQRLGEELEEGTEEEELTEGEVRCEDGVGHGGEEPADEGASISTSVFNRWWYM